MAFLRPCTRCGRKAVLSAGGETACLRHCDDLLAREGPWASTWSAERETEE